VKRTAIAVSMCFGMAPTVALALDWSLYSTQTETVELNSNQFLRSSQLPTVGSYSTITANAEARTPTSKFNFDADGSYNKFWGPGVEGIPSESLNYGFKARYEAIEKTQSDREFIETAWRQQSTSLALLGQLGIALPVKGFLDTLTANGGIDRSVTARDNVSFSAASTRTSYEPSSGGIPFTDTNARGSWRHNFSSITTGSVSSEFELLNFDNASNTSIQIYRNQVGVDATLSPVLSFRGNIGAINLITEGGVNPLTATGANSLGASTSSSLMDWIGDAALTYKMLKDTTFTLIASQSISSSVVGSLFKSDTISAGLNHSINAQSSLSFFASASRQTATTTTDFVSASATYSYNLTRELSAQLTYRYLHRFASSGATSIFDPITGTPTVSGITPADSNSIMLVVSHSYAVLPRGN
jgi:hypothetical protein